MIVLVGNWLNNGMFFFGFIKIMWFIFFGLFIVNWVVIMFFNELLMKCVFFIFNVLRNCFILVVYYLGKVLLVGLMFDFLKLGRLGVSIWKCLERGLIFWL